MNKELRKCKDYKVWNEFVKKSPQSNLFCQTWFLDAFKKEYELLAVYKGESILLGSVIIKDETGQPITQPFMYQGVLFSQSLDVLAPHRRVKKCLELVDFLLVEVEKMYRQIAFSLHTSFVDLRSFQWHNYHAPPKGQFQINLNYTGIIDLKNIQDFDQILMNARTVRRQEYRKCIKEGFTIEESKDISILDKLHEKTFERQGLKRSQSERFMATTLAKESLSKGFGRLIICRDKKGIPASANLFLFDDKTGYYLIGANDPNFRKYGTGTYVLFEQIKNSLEQGLLQVDFVGINSPMRGDFKTSFNAIPAPYFTASLNLRNE